MPPESPPGGRSPGRNADGGDDDGSAERHQQSASLASPDALQSICLRSVSKHLLDICAEVTAGSTDTPYPDVYPPCFTVLRFPASEVFFPTKLAEALLELLGREKKLTDEVMTLFEARSTHLKCARIRGAGQLTSAGLRSLRGHKISELTVEGLSRATVADLVGCLGDWTLRNLHALSVPHCTFVDGNKMALTVSLSKLRNLRSLDVSHTEFNKNALEMVAQDLSLLERLDISCSRVTDVSSLLRCRARLRSLSMYGLRLESGESLSDVLAQLTELRHLDVSAENPADPASQAEAALASASSPDPMAKFRVNQFLTRQQQVAAGPSSSSSEGGVENASAATTAASAPSPILPHLRSLDVSGRDEVTHESLISFLSTHPRLRFLGLVLTDAGKREDVMEAAARHPAGPVALSGSGSEEQVVEALRRYRDRPQYTQISLYNLFKFTQGVETPRRDLIKLVISAANQYRTVFAIQMAATACLYNMSKSENGEKLHPRILSQIVEVDLNAMEEFPQHQQLQKNVLLTICNDRILQEVDFDRFRCAKLVMDCLYTWQNHSMNRMSVAICSILAAKITTAETSKLGSSSNYMQKLLKLVKRRTVDRNIDVTLKFTLSALWNLTDESPGTCEVFLREGGLNLYLEVLKVFPGDESIETKVLGLLNNIAEVRGLRGRLMINEFVSTLGQLMHSSHIDVSYFAAGIVAHLASKSSKKAPEAPAEEKQQEEETDDDADVAMADASEGIGGDGNDDVPGEVGDEVAWTADCVDKPTLMQDLVSVVSGWETPKDEMVAYRSFRPFLPLLETRQDYAVQLWAIWAIHQVCSKNAKRYCPMLRENGCLTVLTLAADSSTHPQVADLAHRVAVVMHDGGFLRGEEELDLFRKSVPTLPVPVGPWKTAEEEGEEEAVAAAKLPRKDGEQNGREAEGEEKK